jgi:endonuclease/exonuclease/phosphatase family metal-dependent hydrolase
VAKGILWASAREGAVPDVIGLAEIENSFVLRRLIQATVLRKLDYRIIHYDSPDRRGIDVALLYRRLKLLDSRPAHLFNADSTIMPTRDILVATFTTQQGDTVAFLVNHHPSKFGGAAASEARRNIAVERLRLLADSLQTLGTKKIIAMGDFNDTPGNPVYHTLEPALWNKAEPFHKKGHGTIKFAGKWELIDMFFVSRPLLQSSKMDIIFIPFLQTPDKAATGTKPLRTYSGPRYLGGVSDHCPVWLRVELK